MRSNTLGGVLICVLASASCTIGNDPGIRLGVPFRAQAPGTLDCGPATGQMWMVYDGFPEATQQEIGQFMGGTTYGVSQQDIADAVNFFTRTSDAYWDFAGYIEFEEFMARQITSIDTYTPVIPIIDFNHAVILNGGDWHAVQGLYQWDWVYYHDPARGRDRRRSSAEWITINCPPGGTCEQIISHAASRDWSTHFAQFSQSVVDSSGFHEEYEDEL